ncbi:MAG: hypothetical protein KAT28_00985 [Candidatus Aenigmarchaeota archaeon]|nr:hypothetical protein [Candidatus Aenigmarchaeota archaeon]
MDSERSKLEEIYQIKEIYYSSMDGYTPPTEKILETCTNKTKADDYLQKLIDENEAKKEALEEAGLKGYYNKFENYQYRMDIIKVNHDD